MIPKDLASSRSAPLLKFMPSMGGLSIVTTSNSHNVHKDEEMQPRTEIPILIRVDTKDREAFVAAPSSPADTNMAPKQGDGTGFLGGSVLPDKVVSKEMSSSEGSSARVLALHGGPASTSDGAGQQITSV